MPFNREVTLFPASGYRNNNDGSLNNVGNNGYYWSAVPNNTNNGCNLNFNQWNVNPQNNNNRSYGFSVRPVSEFTARSGESFSIHNYPGKTLIKTPEKISFLSNIQHLTFNTHHLTPTT